MTTEQDQAFPIRRWKLKNFKSVEEADLELAPLTVLVGANSSGKSSLLQSILLIAQAAQDGPSPWLPLNGALVELGDVQDVIFAGKPPGEVRQSSGKKSKQFQIGAEFDLDASARPGFHLPGPEGRENNTRISWEAIFGSTTRGKDLGAAGLSSAKLVLEVCGEDEEWSYETKGSRRKELEIFSGGRYASGLGEILPLRGVISEFPRDHRRRTRRSARGFGSGPDVRNTAGLVQVGGVPLQHFFEVDRVDFEVREILERLERQHVRRSLPSRREKYESLDAKARKRIETEIALAIVKVLEASEATGARRGPVIKRSRELTQFFMDLSNHQTKRILKLVLKTYGKGEKVLAPADRGPGYSYGIEWVGGALAGFIARNVRYLGPLREDPRVVYPPTPGESEGKVGNKGERAVALLHAHGNDEIACFFHDDQPQHRCTLAEGVKHWLHFFGIAEAIETELRPRLGLEPHLNLPDVDRTLDMTAVGVGVSQIFPVLVMGLHSRPGSVLLMEQPELHLHPALQQRLGDFLLACARSGRQLIVETHSDHLISRLRRRIAEDDSNQLHKSLSIVFTERNEGSTSYRRVEVNRFGGIEEWPQGFFDQAAKESQLILRAGLAKKKQESEQSR
ncbi:MAG: DUF3696 domain-containing protein [bacterium]|nr:DUF3696 domain-containing protein [bacterium]